MLCAHEDALQCVGALYVSTESRVPLVHVMMSVGASVCINLCCEQGRLYSHITLCEYAARVSFVVA
jgi:hypothetical protein